MVAAALDDVIDRRITWAVAQSAAFRDRGPKWEKVSLMLKGMGQGYPKSVYLLKH